MYSTFRHTREGRTHADPCRRWPRLRHKLAATWTLWTADHARARAADQSSIEHSIYPWRRDTNPLDPSAGRLHRKSVKKEIHILLIDDHAIVRSGLKGYLESEDDFRIVAEAGSLEEARAQLSQHPETEIAVVDLRLPDGTGIEFLAHLSEEHPNIRALMLSVNAGERDVIEAVEAGADGYLSKSAEQSELIDAIRNIHAGDTYFPASIHRILERAKARPTLTDREQKTLQLIVKGRSNKEIADSLNTAEVTTRQHVSSILRKLGAKDPKPP